MSEPHDDGGLHMTPQALIYKKRSGAATTMGLIGFLLSLTPFACSLMGWRGAGGLGAAMTGTYFFMGGALLIIASLLEWVTGNAFSVIIFATYGGFWLSLGGTLVPSFAAYSSYAPQDLDNPAAGLSTMGFQASFGFWLLFMGLVSILFAICSLRINVVFIILFSGVALALLLLTGAFWASAENFTGNARVAHRCEVGAGGSAFVSAIAGWYLLASCMIEIVGFPFILPIGDLSKFPGSIKQNKDKV